MATAIATRDQCALTPEESRELTERLASIRGRLDRIEAEAEAIGQELAEIHAKRLYRAYGTWEAFCWQVLRGGRDMGYRLIKLAQVVGYLRSVSQARDIRLSQTASAELARLPQELQLVAFEAAGGNDATAERLKAIRATLEKVGRGEALTEEERGAINQHDQELRAGARDAERLSWLERMGRAKERWRRQLAGEHDPGELQQVRELIVELLAEVDQRLRA